jgi:hypothetical protein
MKRIGLIISLIFIAFATSFSQPALTFKFHGLKAGSDNPMTYTEYTDPGQAGVDIIWNFNNLPAKHSFTGFLNHSATSDFGLNFSNANTELIEFDSRFYFNVSDSKIEELGYSSADGKFQTQYDVPSIKMKYPFQFGQSFSGIFSGRSILNGVNAGTITGNYLVEADAYGTLILPGDHYFKNTLRVRTEKKYTNDFGTLAQQVNLVTYRWYDLTHRYPLLVLTEYSVKFGDITNVYHQAAYSNNPVPVLDPIVEEGMLLFPNPSRSELVMRLDGASIGPIIIDVYDASGVKVRSFQRVALLEGSLEFDLTDDISGLKPSGYLIIVKNGERILRKNFTMIQ